MTMVDLSRVSRIPPCDVDEDALNETLADQYAYHPWTPEKIAAGNIVREALIDAAKAIILNVPPGPDRSVALRKLREARMDANSAITHGGKY